MLVNKDIEINTVVSIKLTSGEEVVGYYDREVDNTIILRKPLSIVMTQNGPAFAPYFYTGDDIKANPKIEFNNNYIIAKIKTNKDFADGYTQAVSGIASAKHNTGKLLS